MLSEEPSAKLDENALGSPSDSGFLWDLTFKTNILMQNNSRRRFKNEEGQQILSVAADSITQISFLA